MESYNDHHPLIPTASFPAIKEKEHKEAYIYRTQDYQVS